MDNSACTGGMPDRARRGRIGQMNGKIKFAFGRNVIGLGIKGVVAEFALHDPPTCLLPFLNAFHKSLVGIIAKRF